MTARDEFPRTTCACELCQVGCRTKPGQLGVGDLRRIWEYSGGDQLPLGWGDEHFCASDGAIVGRHKLGGGMELFRIPTIVPQQRATGECVFFADGECTIHPVAPLGCSHADMHMSKEESDRVVAASLMEICSPAGTPYRMLEASMRERGIVAAPLADRAEAFGRMESEIREKLAASGQETPQV